MCHAGHICRRLAAKCSVLKHCRVPFLRPKLSNSPSVTFYVRTNFVFNLGQQFWLWWEGSQSYQLREACIKIYFAENICCVNTSLLWSISVKLVYCAISVFIERYGRRVGVEPSWDVEKDIFSALYHLSLFTCLLLNKFRSPINSIDQFFVSFFSAVICEIQTFRYHSTYPVSSFYRIGNVS